VLPGRFRASVPRVSATEAAGGSRQLDPVRPWQVRPLAVPAAEQAGVPPEQARGGAAESPARVEQLEAERARLAAELAAAQARARRIEHELAAVRLALAAAETRIHEITAAHAAERAVEQATAQRELDDASRRVEQAEHTLTEAVELIETERSRALAASREQAARLVAAQQRADRAEQRARRAEQRAEAMRQEVLEELAAERARMRAEFGGTGTGDG